MAKSTAAVRDLLIGKSLIGFDTRSEVVCAATAKTGEGVRAMVGEAVHAMIGEAVRASTTKGGESVRLATAKAGEPMR